MDIRKQILQLRNDLMEVVNDAEKINESVAKEATMQVYEDLDELFTLCIDKFYDDYSPKYYRKREHSLYKVYNLFNKNGYVGWDFDASYMPEAYEHSHRATNEYIYDLVFLQGYHGGSHTIDSSKEEQWGKHPEDGTPWYRTPHPSAGENAYVRWSKHRAARSTAPAKDIEANLKKYEKGKLNVLGRTLQDAIDSAYELVLGRYNLFNY